MLDRKIKLIDVIKSVKDVNSNFIPKGTIITVELDGTGDFNNLLDAIDYLEGKYSNGVVIIELGKGTFVTDKRVLIQTDKFNFSQLIIRGQSTTDTIFYRNEWQNRWDDAICVSQLGTPVKIMKLSIRGVRQDNVLDSMGIRVESCGVCHVEKINIYEVTCGLVGYNNGYLHIGECSLSNLSIGIIAQGGYIDTYTGTVITASNLNSLFSVAEAGIIKITRTTINKTNVSSECTVSYNTITGNGVVYRG